MFSGERNIKESTSYSSDNVTVSLKVIQPHECTIGFRAQAVCWSMLLQIQMVIPCSC